ncbi:MAG TPA: alpha/beta hydrolase [Stellaceae bacterium]|nr:alpha/beta hydrolase [Stellaceae bacterium]
MSWQNRVISLFLKFRVKRLTKREPDIAKIRNRPFLKARLAPGWRIQETTTPPLKGEWIEAVDQSGDNRARTLLYFHGGGYFFCSPKTHRPITVALATGAKARTFALDYALAPEHRFPAAVEDAVAAYRGLIAQGVPPARLVLGGDSAGGGLALATLVALRDAGDKLPAGAVLFSPWTDLAGTGRSLITNTKSDVMFHGEGIVRGARIYLGDAAPTHPLASPLYADLAGLPPLFIQASDSEVLLDDSTRLAAKASDAGVSVSFMAWAGLPHVWQIFAGILPEARAALREATDFIIRTVP